MDAVRAFALFQLFDELIRHGRGPVSKGHHAGDAQGRTYGFPIIGLIVQVDEQVTGKHGDDLVHCSVLPPRALMNQRQVHLVGLALEVLAGDPLLARLAMDQIPGAHVDGSSLFTPLPNVSSPPPRGGRARERVMISHSLLPPLPNVSSPPPRGGRVRERVMISHSLLPPPQRFIPSPLRGEGEGEGDDFAFTLAPSPTFHPLPLEGGGGGRG